MKIFHFIINTDIFSISRYNISYLFIYLFGITFSQSWIPKTTGSTNHNQVHLQLLCKCHVILTETDIFRPLRHGKHWGIYCRTGKVRLLKVSIISCGISECIVVQITICSPSFFGTTKISHMKSAYTSVAYLLISLLKCSRCKMYG